MHARFYQMIGAKHARRQNRWLVAANQNLHRMLDVHLVPHSMYRALGDDIPVVEQDYPVGHHVHFVQDVTGNNQVQALRSQLFEERDRFRAHHRIESIKRFVQNQHRRLMSYRLSEAHALTHAFAVGSNPSIGGVK